MKGNWRKASAAWMLVLALVIGLTGCTAGTGASGQSSDASQTEPGGTTGSSTEGTSATTPSVPGHLSDHFEDVFAPTKGSTAVPTTPMDTGGLSTPHTGSTPLTVNQLFTDRAVLQRGVTVPVWGTGENGQTVTVEFAGQSKSATVQDGKWRVDLDAMEASTQNRQLVIRSGDTVLTADNVLVGEVWYASGQSNMAVSLYFMPNDMKKELLQEKGNDSLREFLVTIDKSAEPLSDPRGLWSSAESTKEIVSISQIGYWFAKELQRALQVPVGIVRAAEGATEIELWADTAKIKALGYENPDKPLKEATNYNAMVVPLFPYAVRGMLWYQGEDNIKSELVKATYEDVFRMMLSDLREGFENPEMPVIQVMLPKYIHPSEEGWKHFRYVQMQMQEDLEGVYTTVTIDTGDPEDIHPKVDKPIVAARMAAIALDRVYGVGEPALSPVCVGGRVDGETLTLTFKNVSRGLIVRGTVTDLEVRDASGTWHAATAVVGDDGITLTVTANGVTPVGVRYANASVPSPSLYDKNGLPVAPFWLDTVG